LAAASSLRRVGCSPAPTSCSTRRATIGTIRKVHDEVDAEDPSTSDILHGIIEQLEKYAWVLSAENCVPHENCVS
jgi:hypothetical protein